MIPISFSQAVTSTPKKKPGAQDDPSISVDGLPSFSPAKPGPSRIPLLGLTTPESQEAQRAATRKRFRQFSPPTTGDEPAGLTDFDARPSAKRQKTTMPVPHTVRRVSPPTVKQNAMVTPTMNQGVFGSGVPTNRAKRTSVRPLGAAGGFEDAEDVEAIGRVTPKTRERSLTPLLASSHKVMPRPLQPQRKSSPLKRTQPHPTEVIEIDEGLTPHRSPKAFFSSPASSTSSTSIPKKNEGQSSPGSPSLFALGHSNPNFTINPEAFSPLFTSTQNGPEGDGSGGGGRALRRNGTGSSAVFKFNSQFDVDKNVEDTMALLGREVDVNNWFVGLDRDESLTVGVDD